MWPFPRGRLISRLGAGWPEASIWSFDRLDGEKRNLFSLCSKIQPFTSDKMAAIVHALWTPESSVINVAGKPARMRRFVPSAVRGSRRRHSRPFPHQRR